MTKDNKNNQIIIDFLTQKIKEPFEISNVNWNGSCFTLNIKITLIKVARKRFFT